jgi:signal peptidase I
MRLKKYVSVFFWATLTALAFRFFLLEDYRIFSDSMSPSLLSGDLVFVTKANFNIRLPFSSYEVVRFRTPQRGEVVAFTLPDHGGETYVKRVVATEGDEVSIRDGLFHLNGKPVTGVGEQQSASHLKFETLDGGSVYPIVWDLAQIPNYGPVHIPKGHFFVLGDNRVQSVDSRTWGPIPYSCLKGKVSLIWMSLGPNGLRKERVGRWVRS